MLGMPAKAPTEGGSPVWDALTDDRTTGAAAFAQEAETGLPMISKMDALGGISLLNAVLSPVGVVAGGMNLKKAYDEGDWGEGIKSGLGLGSSLIGTAGLAGTGMTAAGSALGSTGLVSAGAAVSGAVSTGGGGGSYRVCGWHRRPGRS